MRMAWLGWHVPSREEERELARADAAVMKAMSWGWEDLMILPTDRYDALIELFQEQAAAQARGG